MNSQIWHKTNQTLPVKKDKGGPTHVLVKMDVDSVPHTTAVEHLTHKIKGPVTSFHLYKFWALIPKFDIHEPHTLMPDYKLDETFDGSFDDGDLVWEVDTDRVFTYDHKTSIGCNYNSSFKRVIKK